MSDILQLAEATEREIKASSHKSCADEGRDDIQIGTAADNVMPIEVPSHKDEGNLNKSSMSKKRSRKAGGKSQRKSGCTKTNQPAAVHSTKVILSISQTMPTCERVYVENLLEDNSASIQKVPQTQGMNQLIP